MRRYLENTVNSLRKKPEHVRMRIATLFTVLSGLLIAIIWGVVVLPYQYYHGKEGGQEMRDPLVETAKQRYEEITKQKAAEELDRQPEVGGIQNRTDVPDQYLRKQGVLPSSGPMGEAEEAPSPTTTPPDVSDEVQLEDSTATESVPVDVLEESEQEMNAGSDEDF